MRVSSRRWHGLLAAAAFLAASPAKADLSVSVQPAFEGYIEQTGWTAVAVDVDNPGAEWTGKLEVPGDEVRFQHEVSIPGGGHKRFWVPVRYPRSNSMEEKTVELAQKNGPTASGRYRLKPVDSNTLIVGMLSEESLPAGGLARATSPFGYGNVASVQLRGGDMPAHTAGFGAVRAIFAAHWQPASLQPEQVQALQVWLGRGGLLVLSAEPNLTRFQAPWLAPLLPARPIADAKLDVLRALRLHSGPTTVYPGQTPPWSARLETVGDAKILLRAGGAPLVACRGAGLGTICVLSFDISDPAIAASDAWTGLALELIGLFAARPATLRGEDPRTREAPMAQVIEAALGKVSLPSNAGSTTFYFALIYLALLLPGNYFAFKMKNRADDAWIGMVSIIMLSTTVAWGIGRSHQSAVATQGLTIVQAAPGQTAGALIGWIGQFSGERRNVVIKLPPEMETATEITPTAQNAYSRGMMTPAAATQPGTTRMEAAEKSRLLHVPMQAGSLRFFRLEGQAPLGGGLLLEWTEEAGERGLKWTNKTGLDFDAFFIARAGSQTADPTARGAARGAAGYLPARTARVSSLAEIVGDGLTMHEQQLLSGYVNTASRDCPSCAFVVGVPPAGGRSISPASSELPRVYLWPIRDERAGSLLAGRQLLLDNQPNRGGWNNQQNRMTFGAGQFVLDVPVGADVGAAGRDLTVKIQGQWVGQPRIELFDRETGDWSGGTDAAGPAPAGVTEFALPDARHAQLAINPAGQARVALLSPLGKLSVAKLEGGRAHQARVDAGVDLDMAPSLAFDSSQATHVVYRQKGALVMGYEKDGKWVRQPLTGTQGAEAASIALVGGVIQLAYVVPGKGLFHGSWTPTAYSASTVLAEPSIAGPIALYEAAAGQTGIGFTSHGDFDSVAGGGGTWTRANRMGTRAIKIRSINIMGVRAGGRVQGLMLNDGGGGLMPLERLYAFNHPRMGTATNWSRSTVQVNEPVAAVELAMSGMPVYRGAQQQPWAGLVTQSGRVMLLNPNGSATPIGIDNAKPPFAFSIDGAGVSYWLYRGPRGLIARRDTESINGAMAAMGWTTGGRYGQGGVRQEHVATFKNASRFVWSEAGAGRIRLTSQGNTVIDAIAYQGVQ